MALCPPLGVRFVPHSDPRWCRGRGRLLAKVPKDQQPDVGARAMSELIRHTRSSIEKIFSATLAKLGEFD
jgi:hypothetical protein